MSGAEVPSEAWLGIDVGTQGVKVVLAGPRGEVLGTGRQPLSDHRDGDRHEQDPQQWWSATAAACRQAVGGAGATGGSAPSVGGVAVAGTSGTIVWVDDDGEPLSPGLMYDDRRAEAESREVDEAGAQTWQRLGYNSMQPGWALPKALWSLRHTPEVVAGAARLYHQVDLVNRRLVGRDVPTDLSNALKTGCDLMTASWPVEVMESLGVPIHLLPPLVRTGSPIGVVCDRAASETGIAEGTPVLAGATDGCAAQLGAGVHAVGSWNCVLGTTLVLKGVTAELVRDPGGVVYSHRSPEGYWLPGGASSTGAAAVAEWFGGADLAALSAAAARYEPASPICYPLATRGERFPFVAADAEGFMEGEPANEAERFAAVLQGVAHIERLCFDYLRLLGAPCDGDVVFSGGATRNRYWTQLRADTLGRPVRLAANAEPALGMAVVAAARQRGLTAASAEMVRIARTVEPRASAIGRFDHGYAALVARLRARGWLPEAVAGPVLAGVGASR